VEIPETSFDRAMTWTWEPGITGLNPDRFISVAHVHVGQCTFLLF